MMKRMVTAFLLAVMISVLANNAIMSSELKADADYTEDCEEIGTRYYISPELLEALIEKDPSIARNKDDFELAAQELQSLCEDYGDVFPAVYEFVHAKSDNEVWAILDRTRELEKEHGKLL